MQSVHVRTYFHGRKALIALNNFSVYILTVIMQVKCRSEIPDCLNGLLTYLLLLSCIRIVTTMKRKKKDWLMYQDLVVGIWHIRVIDADKLSGAQTIPNLSPKNKTF